MDTNTIDREVTEVLSNVVRHEIKIDWRSHVRSFGFGDRRSTRKGTGNDFDTFRKYERGDDIRRINHHIYAKTRERMVRVDRPETQLYSFVLVDVSNTMNLGTARTTKRHLAAELAASCIVSLDKTKDRVGVVMYSRSGVEDVMRPKIANRSMAYEAVMNVLTKRQAPPPSAPKKSTGLAEALLGHVPHKRALVFVISDFTHYTEADWKALREAGALHDIFCLHVQDERERNLPIPQYNRWFGWLQRMIPSLYTAEDFNGQTQYIWNTPKNRHKYADNFRRFEASVHSRFKEANIRWLVVSTEQGQDAFPQLIEAFGGAR
jgi:uncharacterized protein (DUF58 family)